MPARIGIILAMEAWEGGRAGRVEREADLNYYSTKQEGNVLQNLQ